VSIAESKTYWIIMAVWAAAFVIGYDKFIDGVLWLVG